MMRVVPFSTQQLKNVWLKFRANRPAAEVRRKQRMERSRLVDDISKEVIRECTVGRFREMGKFAASLKREVISL